MSQDSLKKPIIQNKEFFSDLIEKQRAEIEDLNFQKQVLVLDLDDAYKLQSNVLEHNDKLDNENMELKKETQTLNHKLEQNKLQKQEFVKALDKYDEKRADLEGQIKGLKFENQKIKERRSNLNSEINDLKDQNQLFKEENQILKSKLYQNESKIEKQTELENQIHELKVQNQKYKEFVAKLEADIAEKNSSLKSTTEVLKNTEYVNFVLLRQQRQYQNLIRENLAYDEKQVELESQIQELKLEIQKQLKTQDDLEVENKSLKGSLHMVYEDNANLQSEINDLKEKNQSLKKQNESQNEREFELSNQIKELKLESQEQLKIKNDLESRNKYLKERQAELEIQIQVLSNENTAQFEEKNAQIEGKPAKDQFVNTNLHYLATEGSIEPSQLTNMVLKFAKDINSKNKYGTTPLHLAVQNHKLEMVKLLLENGAKINAQNNYKVTPLHISAWQGDAEMTKLLLNYGARKDLVNEQGMTPLEMAKIIHNENIMALLK